MTGDRTRILFAAISFASFFVAHRAFADPHVVVIDAPSDSLLSETVNRLRAELKSAGFDVAVVHQAQSDPQLALEQAAHEEGTMAAMALFRTRDRKAVEVWVLDLLSGKMSMRRVEVPIAMVNAPNVLAVRTTELLKASLLEIKVDPPITSTPRPILPAPVARLMATPDVPVFLSWTLGIGFAAFEHSGGLGLGLAPSLQLSHEIAGGFALRARVAATVVPGVFQAPAGIASVRQQTAVLDLVLPIHPRSFFVPVISFGAGAYHVQVDGKAVPPYVDESPELWAFLLDLGAGFAMRLTAHMSWLFDAHIFTTFPNGDVRINGATIGQVGRPSFLFGSGFVFPI